MDGFAWPLKMRLVYGGNDRGYERERGCRGAITCCWIRRMTKDRKKKNEMSERIPRCSLVVGGRSHADIVGHSSARANAVI